MKNRTCLGILLASLPPLAAGGLDLEQVRKVVFVGDGSTIELTTDATRPYRLVQGRSWSLFGRCRLTRHLDRGVLTLGVDHGARGAWPRCKVTYQANLPARCQVEILQKANRVHAVGQFKRLLLHSAFSDLTFVGNADELTLNGKTVKADVRLAGPQPRGRVTIQARVGRIHLGLDPAAEVSYQLQGTLASFDSTWRNQPGAPLRVDVHADLLEARLAYQRGGAAP